MFSPRVGKLPWRRKWQPTPVFLPGKSHRQRSLAGYSPWDCQESDMTDPMSVHTHTHTQGDIHLNPKSQKSRGIGWEKKGVKKGNQLDISIGGLLLLPHGEKEVGQVSQLLQPGVVWEGRFPKHEQFTSDCCFGEA